MDSWQLRIRRAVQEFQREYSRAPWVFMTEGDVVCSLHSKLLAGPQRPYRATVKGMDGRLLRDWDYQVLTRPLHSELSFRQWGGGGYVDLCIIDPVDMEFQIRERGFSRGEGRVPVADWDWSPSDAIGIEVKFNRWRNKMRAYSRKTNRESATEVWKGFRRSMVYDLKKLRIYKRGWLIFVDHHSLFTTKQEWREFADGLMRDSNYGYKRRTLNAYYIAPCFGKAISFRPPSRSYLGQ